MSVPDTKVVKPRRSGRQKLHHQSWQILTFLFPDFTEEDLKTEGGDTECITFAYRSTKKAVTIKTSPTQYIIEADEFTEMSCLLDHFLLRLSDHYQRMGVKDFRFKLKYDKEFVKQVMHKFLRSIEAHAKERTKLDTSEVSTKQRNNLNNANVVTWPFENLDFWWLSCSVEPCWPSSGCV